MRPKIPHELAEAIREERKYLSVKQIAAKHNVSVGVVYYALKPRKNKYETNISEKVKKIAPSGIWYAGLVDVPYHKSCRLPVYSFACRNTAKMRTF